MSRPFLLAALILLVLLAACAPAASSTESRQSFDEGYGGGAPAEMPPAATAAPAPEMGFDASTAAVDRLVIKNATLSIVVTDPAASVEQIGKMAEDMGGFVVTSNVYQTTINTGVSQAPELVNYGSITIRVPAARLVEAMERIKQGAGEVNNENVSGQDVTQEYTDLQSRLKNLQAAEEQLQQIMDSATKTEDVLAVYNELVRVREQIEVIRGQMQYFEQAAAFSSISVDLQPDAATRPIEIGAWKPQGTAKEAIAAMVKAMQNLADGVIWVALYIAPVLLALAVIFGLLVVLPIYLIVRFIRRGKKGKGTPAAPKPA